MRHEPMLTKVLSSVLPVVSLHLLTSSRKLSYPPVFPTLPSHPRERIGPENCSKKNQNLKGLSDAFWMHSCITIHYGNIYTHWEIWDILSNKICKLPNLKVLSMSLCQLLQVCQGLRNMLLEKQKLTTSASFKILWQKKFWDKKFGDEEFIIFLRITCPSQPRQSPEKKQFVTLLLFLPASKKLYLHGLPSNLIKLQRRSKVSLEVAWWFPATPLVPSDRWRRSDHVELGTLESECAVVVEQRCGTNEAAAPDWTNLIFPLLRKGDVFFVSGIWSSGKKHSQFLSHQCHQNKKHWINNRNGPSNRNEIRTWCWHSWVLVASRHESKAPRDLSALWNSLL